MVTKVLLIFSMFFSVFSALGQKTTTTYFDDNWNKTNQENASYYREVTKQSAKLYLTQDFYLNGQIQMDGHYQDKKGSIETGTFTYYDSTGAKEQVTNYENGERNGSHMLYYSNGEVRLSASYSRGLEVDEYLEFYESGQPRAKANYVEGELVGQLFRFYPGGEKLMDISLDESGSGKLEVFYQDGNLLEKGNYVEGLRDGVWYRYNRSGEVLDSTLFKELEKREQFLKEQEENKRNRRYDVRYAKSISRVFFDSRYVLSDDGDAEVTYFPDVEAVFPGGARAMKIYISENVVYPKKALKRRKESKVYVSFIVEKDGSLSDIRILEGHHFFHKEVLELVRNMPTWIPGEVNGKQVRARCRLPITFSLN